ncbi:MAG: DUF3256 family protein [Bacteroidaceae bacterium]|nr:DUF3256 family protein [Bacteroidaceae bacterium]
MIRRLPIVLTLALLCSHVAAQTDTVAVSDTVKTILMRDVFANMPQKILPLVTKNNRLDCIDFIENNMEARVRNAIDDYVVLEALTSDYLRFRTSNSSYIEMKLLQEDARFIIAFGRTVELGHCFDSHITFYSLDWQALNSDERFTAPDIDAFLPLTPTDDVQRQAMLALRDYHPMCISFSQSEPLIECALQTTDLSTEQSTSIADDLRTVTLRWNGQRFE